MIKDRLQRALGRGAPHRLTLPAGFPLSRVSRIVADGDTMFDGRDDHYLAVGLSALACIEGALEGRVPASILDLPCGWGRVTRMLRARFPLASITVCDIEPAAVSFSAAAFDARPLASEVDVGKLHLPGQYDLIWVGSLMTHLSEAASLGLLARLAAGLAPGGSLVVSSHGPAIIPGLKGWGYGLRPPAVAGLLEDYGARGYGHRGYDDSTGYGIALTDQDWWHSAAAGTEMHVASYSTQAWDEHQDIVVLRQGLTDGPAADAQAVAAEREAYARFDPVMRVFDNDYYLATNPDVAAAISAGHTQTAFTHYLQSGRQEGRRPHREPSERFDEDWYLRSYPDVRAAIESGEFGCAFDHYERFGRTEGRLPFAGADASMTEQERRDRVGAAWSSNPEHAQGWYWMAHPLVRARVNALASGDPAVDSYGRLRAELQKRGVGLPIERAVSLGCGFGALERGLAADGLIREIDAYDIAPAAIAEARRLAEEAGMPGLRYHVADLETMDFLPGQVDVVFAHSSVHHVERLEQLFAAVSAMLKPGGIFHLNEFVGPTRFQWTETQIALVNRFIESLPPRLRQLPSGQPRPLQTRPSIAAMIAADPSESVRSADIIPLIGRYFDILEIRPLGGALLHLGLAEIAQNFRVDSQEDTALLRAFFAAEDEAMREGAVGSDFAIVTAAKRASAADLGRR